MEGFPDGFYLANSDNFKDPSGITQENKFSTI